MERPRKASQKPGELFKRLRNVDPEAFWDDDDAVELELLARARKRASVIRIEPGASKFDFQSASEDRLKFLFRFDREGLLNLANFVFGELVGNRKLYTKYDDAFLPIEGLCIALRVLVSGGRLGDLCETFGRSISGLSRIATEVIDLLAQKAKAVLGVFDMQRLSSQAFVEAIESVVGFETRVAFILDCKLWETAEFGAARGLLYNGDKKRDGFKTVNIVAPDGNCYFMAGPYIGSQHDSSCATDAEIPAKTWRTFREFNVRCYADSAFSRSDALWTNFKRNHMSAEVAQAQAPIQSARGEIEHFFGAVILNFRLLSNRLEMKIGSRPLYDYVVCAVFLTNCLNCHKCADGGNQISKRFGLSPPSLVEYLNYCENLLRQ